MTKLLTLVIGGVLLGGSTIVGKFTLEELKERKIYSLKKEIKEAKEELEEEIIKSNPVLYRMVEMRLERLENNLAGVLVGVKLAKLKDEGINWEA